MNCNENETEKIPDHHSCLPLIAFGPRGLPGPTGPTGPMGPSGTGAKLKGLQLQLQSEGYLTILPNAPIIFNHLLDEDTTSISYNNMTGEFTFLQNKNYYISWWIIGDGTDGPAFISTAFTNGTKTIDSIMPLVTGQLSGSAFIEVTDSPEIWKLINTTGGTIGLGNGTLHANIVIMELS